jgi:hypothetical protein
LARNHDQYLKNETAAALNEKGFPRTFIVGDKVKARFPPTQTELEATGRRSNHVSAWRGPCRVMDRLSSTTYKLVHLDTNREFKRSISNLLPWRAVSNKKAKNAHCVDNTSAPFTVNEIIAVRDEPRGWFFLATISAVTVANIVMHYFGTRSANLTFASFYPGWHLSTQNHIQLSLPNGPRTPHSLYWNSGVISHQQSPRRPKSRIYCRIPPYQQISSLINARSRRIIHLE